MSDLQSDAPFSSIPSANRFWDTNDLLLYALRFISLAELVKFAVVNRRAEAFTKRLIRGRVTRYTSPFFPYTTLERDGTNMMLVRFFQVLEVTHSWIVGSVSLAVASMLSDVEQPDNLNVICIHDYKQAWVDFLVRNCHFKIQRDTVSTGAYEVSGRRYITFVHPGRPGFRITLTTAYGSHLGHLFFAAPNTDQRIAIAPYQVITPYLDAVAKQEHIAGLRPHLITHTGLSSSLPHRTYRSYTSFPGATSLFMDTSHYTEQCGTSCTGRWRLANGLRSIARIKWGGMDGLDDFIDPMLKEIGLTRMQYRLGVKCLNKNCRKIKTFT